MSNLRHVDITRYIMPLREGGSLPGLTDADDGFKYVVKFLGNGHGPKALIAELIGGEVARALGLRVPELVFARLDAAFGRTEPDEEIQELLQKSTGINVALHFLPGAITFDPVVFNVHPLEASLVVWLDALLTNIDRTVRNTNMLIWRKELWLIDHGSCLYFHHAWDNWERHASGPFVQVKDHVLLPNASELEQADALARTRITPALLNDIVDLVPDEWSRWPGSELSPADIRAIYKQFLQQRLARSAAFIAEAQHARTALV
ncbi:MAG: aminotransferase class I and II [Flavobacteriales bacterium]|nr:aminotransferase class I and II [Flavobacteriales bacterium]